MVTNIIREFLTQNPFMAKAIAVPCYRDNETGEFAIATDDPYNGIIAFTNVPKTCNTVDEWLKFAIASHVWMAVTEPTNNPTMENLCDMVDSILNTSVAIWDMSK